MRREPVSRLVRRGLAGGLAVVAFAVVWTLVFRQEADPPQLTAAPPAAKTEPQPLFAEWPADKKPDLVIVLSGQTYGYLQKCGCSNPQKGGLERRFNFIQSLKARGWEVIALDVGDVPKPLPYTPTREQTLTKYETAMQAMKLMDYKAVGVGREELALGLLNATSKYTLQAGNDYPRVHSVNIANPEDFPGRGNGSTITPSDIISTANGVSVGVMSVAGVEVTQQQPDRNVKFAANTGAVVSGVLKKWKAGQEPEVKVLLYQGPLDWIDPDTKRNVDAKSAAAGFPEFNIIVCKTNEGSDAPAMPTVVNGGKTMICEVGQKGQNVGVIGVFKGKAGIGMYYQKVVMTDEFETPAEKAKGHPVLKLLQDYSDTVKEMDYLSEMAKRKKPHAVQVKHPTAAFAGDASCVACHAAEHAAILKTKHVQAYDALAKIAANPVGRQFDGECIVCHTVGYEYKTGYLNEKTTAHLKNVQCESCHGPASLHVAEEHAIAARKQKVRTHLADLSPWKVNGVGMMPDARKIEAMAAEKDDAKRHAMMTPTELRAFDAVYQTCAKCHDQENDPHFKLEVYWPKVAHTGLKK